MKFLISTIIFFCINAKADINNVNVKFEAIGETYKILATNGSMGIIQLNFKGGDYCLGTFKLDESYNAPKKEGHINIYFPGIGQEMYLGNCNNFSLSIDLKGKEPWNLELDEDFETTYIGVRSFGFERNTIVKRFE